MPKEYYEHTTKGIKERIYYNQIQKEFLENMPDEVLLQLSQDVENEIKRRVEDEHTDWTTTL